MTVKPVIQYVKPVIQYVRNFSTMKEFLRWRSLFVRVLRSICTVIPFSVAMRIVNVLLESQGFGSGARIEKSGEILAARQFLSSRRRTPITILDIGANRGEYTEAVLKEFPDAVVHAFEPSLPTYSLLQARVSGKKHVFLHNIALGLCEEKKFLYKENKYARIASFTPLDVSNNEFTEEISVYSLDQIIDALKIDSVDLAKIDVEGHEMDVLRGAERTISDNRIKNIQFELGGSSIDTNTTLKMFYDFLVGYNYDIFLIQPKGVKRLDSYKYGYEQYSTTNFFAALRA